MTEKTYAQLAPRTTQRIGHRLTRYRQETNNWTLEEKAKCP